MFLKRWVIIFNVWNFSGLMFFFRNGGRTMFSGFPMKKNSNLVKYAESLLVLVWKKPMLSVPVQIVLVTQYNDIWNESRKYMRFLCKNKFLFIYFRNSNSQRSCVVNCKFHETGLSQARNCTFHNLSRAVTWRETIERTIYTPKPYVHTILRN